MALLPSLDGRCSQHGPKSLTFCICGVSAHYDVPVHAATKRSGLTALSEAGLSIEDIQAMGRHKNSSMTREYIVDDDAKRARASEALARMIDDERQK